MNYTVVSKRKIAKLISEGIVRSWDDPRLFTLTALRRRGIPPQAINNFISKLGVTGAQMVVDPQMLDASVRDVLNTTARRVMCVLEPLKVTIENLPFQSEVVEVLNFPNEPERGSHNVVFSKTVYIEQSDFRETGDKDFRRLTPDQPVGLAQVGYVVSVKSLKKDSNGKVTEILANGSPLGETSKPKAFIHWVSNPISCEVRLYERLFLHKSPEDPKEVPGGFLSDISSNSLSIIEDALIAPESIVDAKVYDQFQFSRQGYFSVDPDTNPHKVVFNRTVTLREDAGKS